MANLDKLTGMIPSATDVETATGWPSWLVEDYVSMFRNIATLSGEVSGKQGVSLGLQAVLTTDTPVVTITLPVTRVIISAATLYNNTGSGITVDTYISPDLTSASGTLIDTTLVPSGGNESIAALIGQGISSTQNVVCVATAVGVNALITVTEFN